MQAPLPRLCAGICLVLQGFTESRKTGDMPASSYSSGQVGITASVQLAEVFTGMTHSASAWCILLYQPEPNLGSAPQNSCLHACDRLMMKNASFAALQALPVLVPQQCRQRVAEADGGFVTVTLQPHHLRDDSLDRVAWSVLTFQEYMSLHVKSFQVGALA